MAGVRTLLVFDGIKMGAEIFLNGKSLGLATDQFLRYNFSVQSLLKPTGNLLSVTFPEKYGIDTQGRFMACSGGWDWYVYTFSFSVLLSPPLYHSFLSSKYS